MRVNRRVSIWKHVRLADGKWRYCRPVFDDKGKIVSDIVMVKEREERHAEGTYSICFYNPKLTWQKCGRKPADAVAAAERQRALFKAMEHGIVERPKKSQATGPIDEAVTAYLEELEAKVGNGSKRPQTHAACKQILREFQAYCERKGKKSLSKITKLDLLNYAGWAHQQSPTKSRRTANTKFIRVNQFLKAQGIFIATNAEVHEEPARACLFGRGTREVLRQVQPLGAPCEAASRGWLAYMRRPPRRGSRSRNRAGQLQSLAEEDPWQI